MEDKGLELSQRKISRSDDVHYDFPDSLHLLESHGNKRHQNLRWRELLFCAIFGLSLVLSIAALSYSGSIDRRTERLRAQVFRREDGTLARHLGYTPLVRDKLVKRIAFGSCTSHHVDEQTIWTQGIIPSDPDAWIWLGDMAYLASAFVDCEDAPSNVEQCNCTPDWLHSPPKGCMAGDLDHAREKMRRQLLVAGYQKFLDFMCPGFLRHGMFPPLGADSEICPRPIIGTYDDNDFGMNNGNRRLPNKFEMKQIYLDGIGEARNSPRRSTAQGIQWKYTFNEGRREQLIDLYLLDERYERDTLPCHMRREWCERVLEDKNNEDFAWCTDFVVNGGLLGNGSCCTADDEFFKGWCVQEGSKDDPNWSVACDPTSSSFASKPLTLSFTQPGFPNGALAEIKESKWESVDEVSPFCEVLGPRQRQWLSQSLAESQAPLKLIASGSVVLGNPVHIGKKRKGHCSSDDWECYYPAQLQLLHTIGNMPKGCVVILTGDYHISDIKVLEAGTEKKYPKDYRTEGLSVPIYQVMASGMTNNTAKYHRDDKVCDKWRRDPAGFRPCGPCSFMAYPAFGFLEVDWDTREVHIQIRDGSDGTKVARGDDGSELSLSFSLDTCKPVAPPSCKGGK